MPSGIVTADVASQTVFRSPSNKVSHITGIEVDNRGAIVTLTLQDSFNTTASAGALAVTPVVAARKVITVAAGTHYDWSDETKSIEIFGDCQVISTATVPCDITVMWE